MFSSNSSGGTSEWSDVLVVGHGLAGAILAQELRHRGQRILVIDQAAPSSASRVAAGIINPVTGHRLNLTNGFHQFFPDAMAFYARFEQEFRVPVFTPKHQTRLIKNAGQWDYYLKRKSQTDYEHVLGRYSSSSPRFRNTPYGVVEIRQSGVVNTECLLDACTETLLHERTIHFGDFNHAKLTALNPGFEYGGRRFHHVVFCEGHAATRNPWLKDLPFRLSKGEILDIKLSQPLDEFLNWGSWLVPASDQITGRLGSTYEWDNLDSGPTQTDRLLRSAEDFLRFQVEVIRSRTGIRPTTRERVPFVGPIAGLPGAYCFNGFGSKGCLLIPHYAKRLIEHVYRQAALPAEVLRWL